MQHLDGNANRSLPDLVTGSVEGTPVSIHLELQNPIITPHGHLHPRPRLATRRHPVHRFHWVGARDVRTRSARP